MPCPTITFSNWFSQEPLTTALSALNADNIHRPVGVTVAVAIISVSCSRLRLRGQGDLVLRPLIMVEGLSPARSSQRPRVQIAVISWPCQGREYAHLYRRRGQTVRGLG
jgi:hypothetical protein